MQQILLGAIPPPSPVFLTNVTANAQRILPDVANALASIGIYPDGFVKRSINGGPYLNQYSWLTSGVAADYDVRLTAVSGLAPAGPSLSTWHSMSLAQVWSLGQPGGVVGASSFVGTIELSYAGIAVPLIAATFTLNAEVTI